MAVLPDTDRFEVWAQMMSDQGNITGQPFGALVKADLRAAVNALDDFLETNTATINAAIPQPARAELTVQQKALLLQFVIARRYLRA
jgi:hypothetical protein